MKRFGSSSVSNYPFEVPADPKLRTRDTLRVIGGQLLPAFHEGPEVRVMGETLNEHVKVVGHVGVRANCKVRQSRGAQKLLPALRDDRGVEEYAAPRFCKQREEIEPRTEVGAPR